MNSKNAKQTLSEITVKTLESYKPSRVLANVHAQILEVPSTTGVYVYMQNNVPLYIGKAVSLRARLLSHEQNAQTDRKESQIVTGADTILLYFTDSELQALLLEARLISEYKPKYNVRWRDDKSPLYIKITISETYPKVYTVRKEDDKKSLYFGPFSSVKSAESLIYHLRKVVPFCTQKTIQNRACFSHKIGLCNPCPSLIAKTANIELQKKETAKYRRQIRLLLSILQGKTEKVISTLSRDIRKYSKIQEYEKAMQCRNALTQLEYLQRFSDLRSFENLITNRPQQSLIALQTLLRPFFEGLQAISRIECYDNSALQFQHATASMVVSTNGMIDKKEYRKFRLRTKSDNDFDMMKEVFTRRFAHQTWPLPDLIVVDGGKPQLKAAITVLRPTSNVLSQGNVISSKLGTTDYGPRTIPIIGLAKNPDRLVVTVAERYATVRPSRSDLGFRLLQNLRDEAHRFAKKYHTTLRTKATLV